MTLLLHIASIFMTSHSFEMLILGPKVKQIQEKRDKTIIAINKYLLSKSFEMIETLVTKSKFFRKPQYAKTALNSEELFMLQHYRIRLSIELYTKSYFGTPKNERAKTKPGWDPMYVHEAFDDALQTFFSNQNYKKMTTELQKCKGNGIEMSSEAISDAYRLYIIHYLHNAVYECIYNTRKDNNIWHKFLVSLYKDCVYGLNCGIDIMRDYDGVYTHLFECIEFKESTNFYDDIKNFFAKSALSFDKGEQVAKKKILLIDFSWYFISFLTDIEDAENRNTLFNTIEKYLGTIIDCLRVNSKKMRSMDQNLELLHLSSCSFSMINSLSDIEKMFCFSEIDMAKFKDLFTIANSLRLVILHYKDMLRKNLVQIRVLKNDKICMKHKQPGNLPLTSTKNNNDETEIEEVKNVFSVNFEVDKFVKFRVIISSKIDSSAKEAALCEDFGTSETLMQIKVGDQQYDKLSKFCGFEALKNLECIDTTESVQSSIPKPKKNKRIAEIAKDDARPSIDLKSQAVEGKNKIDTDRPETLEDFKQSSLPKEIDSELHIEKRQATAARNENQADSKRDYQNVHCIDQRKTQPCESNMQNEKDIDLLPIVLGENQAMTNKCNALPGSVTANPKDDIQNSSIPKSDETAVENDKATTEIVKTINYPDPRADNAYSSRAHTAHKNSLQGSKNNEQNAGNVQDTIPVHADVSKVSESSKNPPDTCETKEQPNKGAETSFTFFEGSKMAEKEYERLRQSNLNASAGSNKQTVSKPKDRKVTKERALNPDKHQPDSTDATAGTMQHPHTNQIQQQAANPLQCPSNQDYPPFYTASESTDTLSEEGVILNSGIARETAPPNTLNEQRTRSQLPIPDKFDLEAAESERINRITRAENEREANELFSALDLEISLIQAEFEKSIAIEMDKKEEIELFSVLDLKTSLIREEFENEEQKCSEAQRAMTINV